MRKLIGVALSLALGLTVLMATPASAGPPLVCDEVLDNNLTLTGKVIVPGDGYCRTEYSTINGSVKLVDGTTGFGTAFCLHYSTVHGNIYVGANSDLCFIGSTLIGRLECAPGATIDDTGATFIGSVDEDCVFPIPG